MRKLITKILSCVVSLAMILGLASTIVEASNSSVSLCSIDNLEGHINNPTLMTTSFTTGIDQQVKIAFDVDQDYSSLDNDNCYFFFQITDPDGNSPDGFYWSEYVNNASYSGGKLICSKNLVFEKRGQYKISFEVYNDGNGHFDLGSQTFTVKSLTSTDDDGNETRINDSVKISSTTFEPKKEANGTITYTLANPKHTYYLYVVTPRGEDAGGEYKDDDYYLVKSLDWHSDAGELDTTAGKTCTKKFKYTFTDNGVYGVVLYDKTNNKIVAHTTFTVSKTIDNGDQDASKVVNGKMPFYYEFKNNKTHLELDSDDEIDLSIQLPYKYDLYQEDMEKKLAANSYRDNTDLEFDKTTTADVRIMYQPAGSSSQRCLDTIMISGYRQIKKFKYSSEDILKLLSNYTASDSAYAGIVTLEITGSGDGRYYVDPYTESVSFSVAKKAGLKKAKAVTSATTRAYGEKQGFYVEDNLGGTIYATIYSGSKKIKTVKANCQLSSSIDGNAFGYVYWDLKNSSGKYLANGKYKAVIYTEAKITILDNGKKTTKTLKSKSKTVNFQIKKPSGKLSLKSSAIGSSGGEYAIYESPIIGIQNKVNIGSKISVKITNTKGTVIKKDSYIQSAGTTTRVYDLSQLDSNLSIGTYKAAVTAQTLAGKKITKNISFKVEKAPQVTISNTSLSINDGVGTLSFKTSQSSNVNIVVKDSSDKVVVVVEDGNYTAGTIKTTFSTGNYAAGNYKVVITAKNSGGTSTETKTFTIAKKPVVVEKPTVSGLSVKYTKKNKDDAYTVYVNYTGKNTKLVIEIMYEDNEEIVYTYEKITSNDKGQINWTWDGYKANGFRAWTGNYTVRAYAINSAGKTEYLRERFTISEG